jgi:hypothetical protein
MVGHGQSTTVDVPQYITLKKKMHHSSIPEQNLFMVTTAKGIGRVQEHRVRKSSCFKIILQNIVLRNQTTQKFKLASGFAGRCQSFGNTQSPFSDLVELCLK